MTLEKSENSQIWLLHSTVTHIFARKKVTSDSVVWIRSSEFLAVSLAWRGGARNFMCMHSAKDHTQRQQPCAQPAALLLLSPPGDRQHQAPQPERAFTACLPFRDTRRRPSTTFASWWGLYLLQKGFFFFSNLKVCRGKGQGNALPVCLYPRGLEVLL